MNGALHLAENPELVKQVAVADRLVITKTDLAEAGAIAGLEAELRRLNPTAPIRDAARDRCAPDDLMASDVYDPGPRAPKCATGWTRRRTGPQRMARISTIATGTPATSTPSA